MSKIQWITPSGSQASLEIVTERTINLDGDTVTVPDYTLVGTGGPYVVHNPSIETHEIAGLCLRQGNTAIGVSGEVEGAVRAMVAEYRAEMARRDEVALKVATEHHDGHARILRAMGR